MPPAQRVVTLVVAPLLVLSAVMGAVMVVLTVGGGVETASRDSADRREPGLLAPPGPPSVAVLDDARPSAVLITATGCPSESIGSGVVLEAGVITNAHVVAGATEVLVTATDGRQYPAEIRAFDPVLDLALLDVGDILLPPLDVAKPQSGTETVALVRDDLNAGAALQPLPLSIERTINIFIADIYGAGRHERRGIEVHGDIGPGDSGAGIIDGNGAVVGVVFSASRRSVDVGYAISATELAGFVAARSSTPADSGSCLRG
jgi:S1-C subfamily serine protease